MISTRFAAFALVALASTLASSPASAESDHQQCYKIKDSAAAATYTADLTPTDGAFPVAAGCQVKVPAKLLCIDVEKTNVTPTPPGADDGLPAQKSLCYKVKCPALASPITATETDQFGVHGLEVKKSFLLCAPVPAPVVGECTTAGDCPAVANGMAACVGNNCEIGSCNAGFADCNLAEPDGCEVGTTSDLNNCGGCGSVCPTPANATASCTSSVCGIGSCNAGFSDCDSMNGNGCEASTLTDPNNCGACNSVCSFPNANAGCTAGACTIGSCNVGFSDCDLNPGNGCETGTQSDPNNCGSCLIVCPGGAPNCVAGTCVP